MEQAIAASIIQLRNWVQSCQPNVHVNAIPWLVKGVKEWLWVIAQKQFCLFAAANTRCRAELEKLLGTEYHRVLSSDDFSVYNGYSAVAQHKC